ncbi:MAG: ABC transporter ATP-binding protein [Gammaproteobacteria bacterium]|nr:ABC transporter ATP-binding protein [Gammaproteobacteria bacterium]
MILAMSLLDVAGVASVLPFLAVLADPQVIHGSAPLSAVYSGLGFSSERSFLLLLGAAVFFIVVTGLAFKTMTLYALTRFSTMRNYSISSRLLHGYMSQPYVWFLSRHSADLGKTVLSEVDQVISGCVIPAMTLLAHSTVLIALIALLMFVDAKTTLIASTLLLGSYVLIFVLVRRLLSRLGKKRVDANLHRYKVASEALGGIKDVKLLGLERAFLRRFRPPAEVFARTQAAGRIISQVPRFALEAVAFGGMLTFILALLAQGDRRLEEIVPILGLFAFASVRMFPATQQVYQALTAMRFGRYALAALHRDFFETGDADFPDLDIKPLSLQREIELRDVTYRYPQSKLNALDGMNLVIKAQSTVGLVGGTGAGKTTAVDVVLGLLRPTEGALRVDGTEITAANLSSWQRSVGYVPQQIYLTDDTVTANIAFGIPPGEVDHGEVERAATVAGLHHFVITELPLGYATMVGERGVRLSGGQRQRIGIARALYHDPDVLVLDEATSALDNLTERAVMDAVRNLAGFKTIILVAHRLTTVENCDRIFLIDRGAVLAEGHYRELLETSTRFRQMVEAAA